MIRKLTRKDAVIATLGMAVLTFAFWGCDSVARAEILSVRHLRVLDPGSGIDLRDGFVACREGVIIDVGPDAEAPSVARRSIDGGGRVAIPGLVDAHVHFRHLLSEPEVIKAWPAGGITAVIELGGPAAPPPDPRHPTTFRSGPILTAPHGYPSPEGAEVTARYVHSPSEAEEIVRHLARTERVDLVKIAVERGFLADLDDEGWPVFDRKTVELIVNVAHQEGLKVVAHLTQLGELELALEAGVDALAHAPIDPIPDEILRGMAERQVIMVSTLSVWAESEFLDTAADNLARYAALGGPIAMGTDAPAFQPPGAPKQELELLRAAALSHEAILRSMTAAPRLLLGDRARIGRLGPGERCDLVILDGDPLESLQTLLAPWLVIMNGHRLTN